MDKNQFINRGFYYSGTIVEVIDPVLYQIKVDIPGIAQGVMAFPHRGEVDEPRVGDFVMLKCFDPLYQSYYLYYKIKENDFIGFRSNGKMVDITPDYITVGIFDPETEYNDLMEDGYRLEVTDWIKIDKDGNLDINMRKDSTINIEGSNTVTIKGDNTVTIEGSNTVTIKGDSSLTIEGSDTVKVSGDCNVNVDGATKLTCPDVTVTGGKLTMAGTSSSDNQGPFNCIPVCPFSGAPHRGKVVSGT